MNPEQKIKRTRKRGERGAPLNVYFTPADLDLLADAKSEGKAKGVGASVILLSWARAGKPT